MSETKLTDEILGVLAASPEAYFDASDVLTKLERLGGREYRLASVFNTMLDLSAAGRIAIAGKAGNRTLYRLSDAGLAAALSNPESE